MKNIFRGIAAIVVGILLGAILSIATDMVFEMSGLVPPIAARAANGSPTWFLIVAIVYRSIYTVLSCYAGALVAPNHHMRYAVALGIIAFAANLAGTIGMWSLGQHWYPISLTILAIPCAWLGGMWCLKTKHL